MKNIRLFCFLVLGLAGLLLNTGLQAQISHGGSPPSVVRGVQNDLFPVFEIPAPNTKQLLAEDAFTDKHGIAMRFAVSAPVDIDLLKEGAWSRMADGPRICRLAVSSKDAQALILYYSSFSIPDGADLFLYSADRSQVIGAFDHQSNYGGGGFATEMIVGETAILEYAEYRNNIDRANIVISEVSYVYRAAGRIFDERGFGGSDTCEVNVNCQEGLQWQNQKRSVARIIVKQGFTSFLCTGSLLNNTRQVNTPYFLTATHCGPNATPGDLEKWIFYFRYEGPGCDNPLNDLLFNFYTMVGAEKIASSSGPGQGSDFKLLLLEQMVPGNYQPYFNGWSLLNEKSPSGVTIHHPEGDIKKISTYTEPLVSSNWGSIPNTHWEVVWSPTANNWGVTEAGSSGSPIFDSEGRIIGQLTGGEASCSNLTGPDYYGKIWYSWDKNAAADSTMLKPWLDPDNTGVLTLDGLVAINEHQMPQKQEPAAYPNPTSGDLFIELPDTESPEAVRLFDSMGKLIMEIDCRMDGKSIHVDMRRMKQGLYFLDIRTQSNTYVHKVIR